MNLDTILAILTKLNTLLPLALAIEKMLMALFKDATPNLSNAERIALLRAAGVKLDDKGEAWLVEHGLEL